MDWWQSPFAELIAAVLGAVLGWFSRQITRK